MREHPPESGAIWTMHMMEAEKRQATEALFNDMPLQNPAQHFLLFVIENGSDQEVPPTQGDIARRMKLSPATVTASLRFLEKRGLIQRETDEHDLRKNRVRITPKGRETAQRCRESMKALETAMMEGFSDEEQAQLAGYFSRMCDNLRTITKHYKEVSPF